MNDQPPALTPMFADASTPTEPKLEFCFAIRLYFTRVNMLGDMPSGAARGAVYIDGGNVEGPRLKGKVLPGSGADWSLFRPDGVLATDARYMLEADDGTLILLHNRGYLWGRTPDVIPRIQDWMFRGGSPVPNNEFYLRAAPTFEVAKGKHDWLMRHIFVGLGDRYADGNIIRYFALL
ncbi:MAG TPA: DUF3237 domain-containing protein [Steroidobacteraceae bacterium]|nr:DUF3237 domain-containing protein [Steroidobacteraceae bacterium]